MVFPPGRFGTRKQDRRIERMHRRNSSTLEYEFAKLEAKYETKKAAENALENILNGTHYYHHDNDDDDDDAKLSTTKKRRSSSSLASKQDESESVMSAEVAIQRGSLRGLTEMNESPSNHNMTRDELFQRDFDLTTVTEGESEDSSKRKMMKFFRKKKHKSNSGNNRKKNKEMSLLSKEISKEAWMCGCCGKVFSTYGAADYHEKNCIQTVLDTLGEDKEQDGSVDGSALRRPPEAMTPDFRRPSETMTPDFRRARAEFLGTPVRGSLAMSPIDESLSNNQVTDDLLDDIGLGEESKEDTSPLRSLRQFSSSSIFESARSVEVSNNALRDGAHPSPLASPAINQIRIGDVAVEPSPLLSPFSRVNKRRLSTRFNLAAENNTDPVDVLLTRSMRHQIIMTDEALVNAVQRASKVLLSPVELEAEREIKCIARDKTYYDEMCVRACTFKAHPMAKFRTDGKTVISKLQNRFVDAYQLIKEGDTEQDAFRDQYEKSRGGDDHAELVHDQATMYVNVVVKHSVGVVGSELERLAQQRWEDQAQDVGERKFESFEQFRNFAHVNLVKLAKLALSTDFTPRKVAVQLSNDLYRLMAPQLKRRGVKIETEIEYRVGPYFVLAVNIKSIDFTKLIKYTHRLLAKRAKEWEKLQERRDELQKDMFHEEGNKGANNPVTALFGWLRRISNLTRLEFLAQFLAFMYYFHWIVHIPLCWIVYRLVFSMTMRRYILSTVADEIFSYVEEKGMEMEIGIVQPYRQAAFMLSALREIREGTKKSKKGGADGDKGEIVGPLLGPAIKADKGPAPPVPDDVPENLEFVNFELDLPVGFRRLRWAMLATESSFSKDALFPEAKLENTSLGEWNRHDDLIGKPSVPADVTDIVGAERESSYLMPKSAFVKANMNHETQQITAYNDYCFCIKKRTLSPEVPYGSTFVTWTQQVIVNTGNDSCKLICSVEPEFPNGPPMISRQIQSGMRAGTAESFALMAEVIIKYAHEYP